MKCPFCDGDANFGAYFCPRCGRRLDVSFQEIQHSLAGDARDEERRRKLREGTRVFWLAVFMLAVSAIVYAAIPSPVLPDAVPVYRVPVPELGEPPQPPLEGLEFDIPR